MPYTVRGGPSASTARGDATEVALLHTEFAAVGLGVPGAPLFSRGLRPYARLEPLAGPQMLLKPSHQCVRGERAVLFGSEPVASTLNDHEVGLNAFASKR